MKILLHILLFYIFICYNLVITKNKGEKMLNMTLEDILIKIDSKIIKLTKADYVILYPKDKDIIWILGKKLGEQNEKTIAVLKSILYPHIKEIGYYYLKVSNLWQKTTKEAYELSNMLPKVRINMEYFDESWEILHSAELSDDEAIKLVEEFLIDITKTQAKQKGEK